MLFRSPAAGGRVSAPATPGRESLIQPLTATPVQRLYLPMLPQPTVQTIMTQVCSRLLGKEQDRRSPVALATYRSLNAIQPEVFCEASRSVTSRIPSGPTTWNVQGAVSRPIAAWRTRRKMYASASLISTVPGLRRTIIAFSSS